MQLACSMHRLQLDRRFNVGVIGHVEREAVPHEGAVQPTDCVVGVEGRQAFGSGTVGKRVAVERDAEPLRQTCRPLGHTLLDVEHMGARDQRVDGLGNRLWLFGGKGAQQGLQVGVVEGLDATRRQTLALQRIEQAVALQKHGAIAGQTADLVGIGVDELGLGCGEPVGPLAMSSLQLL